MAKPQDFKDFFEGFSRDEFFYAHDTQGVFTYLSPSLTAVLGYTQDEFKTHFTTYLTDDPVNWEVERRTSLSIQGTEQPPYEVSIRHKDGSVRWLEVKERPVRSPGGEVRGVEGHARDITARKAAEADLRKVRAAVEQAGDAIAIADLQGTISFVNPAWAKMHGFEPAELIGKSLAMFHTAEQLRLDVEPFNARVMSQGSHQGPVGHVRRDGGEFPTWMSTVLFHDEAGRPVGFLGLARDISEEELRAVRARLARTVLARLNTSGDLTAMLRDVSRAIRESGLADGAAFDTGEGLLVWDGEGAHPGAGLPSRADIPLRSDDGAMGTLVLFSRSPKGFPPQLATFFEGLGASIAIGIRRTRAEADLQRREERYRDLVENLEELVLVLDLEGRIVFANTSCQTLLGRPVDQTVGRPVSEIVDPAYHDALAAALREDASKHRCALLTASGESLPVATSCRRVLGRKGDEVIRVIVRDLRTENLLQEQSARVEKLRSLGVLAGGVAHDFNNYLTAILGCLGLVQEMPGLPAEVPELIGGAERAALKAHDLARQLLYFSRGGAPDKRPLDLASLARDSASLALSGSAVRLETDFLAQALTVEADASQLSQVFANLAINAREAMPGGGLLRLEAERVDIGPDEARTRGVSPSPYVHLRVRDQGAGIRPDILERIYDPFFTTKGAGSGMGLAVCHAIISKHAGAIWAESAVGRGSVFHILLPASDKTPPVEAAFSSLIVPGSGKVLVMDDENTVRSSVAAILKAAGYEVAAVADGDAALARFEAARAAGAPFRLALLDLVVKGAMGGMETAAALRALDPGTRLVAMSGYSEEATPGSLAEMGFAAFLPKPFQPHALTALLADVLTRR
ncbi:MAG: PAS domain S-box protein [Elusimicrobia bacterium]|nr:PAS domain S-box protein [Elusimicrobiota bacterium]